MPDYVVQSPDSGVRSTNLPSSTIVNEVVGNKDLGGGASQTVRIAVGALANILAPYGTHIVFGTLAEMNASLAYPANTGGEVWADPNPINNGIYRKSGASGTGSWTKIASLSMVQIANRLAALEVDLEAAQGNIATAQDAASLVSGASRAHPGDAPVLYTSSLAGEASAKPALTSTSAIAAGRAVILTGAGKAAPREPVHFEAGHTYLIRYRVERTINTPDPAGDAVTLKIQWQNRVKEALSTATFATISDLTTSSGQVERTFRVAGASGSGINAVWPNGGVYGVPYVETFGTTCATAVHVIDVVDVTYWGIDGRDVTELETRIAAIEDDIPARVAALETEVGTPGVLTYPTVGDLEAATIPGSPDIVEVLSTATAGDEGYRRFVRGSEVAGAVQSDDGQWWVPIGSTVEARPTQAEAEAGAENTKRMTALRTKQALISQTSTLNLYCMGDSWVYVDDRATPNSFTLAAEIALDAEFGAGRWRVINCGIGGTAISTDVSVPAAPNNMVYRIPTRITRYGDATLVQLEGGVNDIALGQTDVEIIAGIQDEIDLLEAQNIPFVICTIGPFKGASFYNSTTRGYVDAVNAWIRTNYSSTHQVVDLWNLFNDTADDGAFLSAYRFDDFHPNHAGKTLWAETLAANAYVQSTNADPTVYATATTISRGVQRSRDAAFRNVVIGTDDGIVRPLTIRSPDQLTELEHMYLAQYNDPSSGWMVHADVGGNILFKRFASGVSLVTRWLIGGIATAFSTLNTRLWVQADGTNARFSGTTYGGGVGAAIEVGISSATATSVTAYKQAGSGFGELSVSAGTIDLQIAGVSKIQIASDGSIYFPGMPSYANNTAAAAALAVGATYYNTTSHAYSRVE